MPEDVGSLWPVVVHRPFTPRGDNALMTLSEDEQNSIYRIAISLLADDPRMASRLDVEAVKFSLYRRRRLATMRCGSASPSCCSVLASPKVDSPSAQ